VIIPFRGEQVMQDSSDFFLLTRNVYSIVAGLIIVSCMGSIRVRDEGLAIDLPAVGPHQIEVATHEGFR
jgi:hypothetical protein